MKKADLLEKWGFCSTTMTRSLDSMNGKVQADAIHNSGVDTCYREGISQPFLSAQTFKKHIARS